MLLGSSWACPAQCQCAPRLGQRSQESFSSLAAAGGLPYPSGIELTLKENGSRVEATLLDYAGEPQPRESTLTGRIREIKSGATIVCVVDLAGARKSGAVRIHGTIRPADFFGTIQRRVGSDIYSERVSLRRRAPQYDPDTGAF